MAAALTDQRAAARGEMPDEIAPPDHVDDARKFVMICLLGHLMSNLAPQPISISIVYEPVEPGWIQARIEGIPEVITAGPTKDEARRLVLDALREYLLSIRGNGDAVDRELLDLQIAH
jgi:hypothetical protein